MPMALSVRIKFTQVVTAVALAVSASLVLGAGVLSEYGPLPGATGAPALRSKPEEFNCTLCHFAGATSNFNTTGGAVRILGLPKTYTAGQTYRLGVRLSTDSTAADPSRLWGFEITAVRAADGEGAGTFILDDADS